MFRLCDVRLGKVPSLRRRRGVSILLRKRAGFTYVTDIRITYHFGWLYSRRFYQGFTCVHHSNLCLARVFRVIHPTLRLLPGLLRGAFPSASDLAITRGACDGGNSSLH